METSASSSLPILPKKFVPETKEVENLALKFFTQKNQEEWNRWISKDVENLSLKRNFLKESFITKNKDVQFPLSEKEIDSLLDKYFKFSFLKNQYRFLTLKEIGEQGQLPEQTIEASLALGALALYKLFDIDPYDTQILTVLAALSHPNDKKGRLAQVKTGEGKSTIITLQALSLALQGRGVHIISSSEVLSIRDQKKYVDFFKLFGYTTSHICDLKVKPDHFDAHILYGAATDFEFALMREHMNDQTLFSSKKAPIFDSVIVDEVDNLLIDTAANSARISYPYKKGSKLQIFLFIFQIVQKNQDLLAYEDFFKKTNFSTERLITWWTSALTALKQQEDIHYIIQRGKQSQIKIIDHQNTGQISEGMRWGSGLHEFLELKHDIQPKQESITPISLSHAVFYDKYATIFGFSGTLGSTIERDLVETTYQIDTFDVPSYRPSKRKDFPPQYFESEKTLCDALIKTVREMQKGGRPVLILSLSIKDSKELQALLKNEKIEAQLFNEMQSEPAESIIDLAGKPGVVTIATNNAGRGTDIILDPSSEKNGGLHVIFTYLPNSQRVEDQGIGRAGRQGQNGSSEIFIAGQINALDRIQKEKNLATMLKKRAQGERYVNKYAQIFWNAISEWRGKREVQDFDFIGEQKLADLEKETVLVWAENFFEPCEELIFSYQENISPFEDFKKEVDALFQESRPKWKNLIGMS